MTNPHGDFVWYELMTPDAEAAARFYGDVVGWIVGDQYDYREIQAGDGDHIGGMLPLSPEMSAGGARPAWVAYISVDDVDASVAAIEAAGGRCHMPARDMEGVGRFAMVTDPQGAHFYVMKPTPPAGRPRAESTAFARYEPQVGHCAWNELATSDTGAAKAFYKAQFGWEKQGEMDMGPMGTYEFLQVPGERPYGLGAVYKMVSEDPHPHWLFYFRVPDIDAAGGRVEAGGGRIHIPAMEIPGGDFSLTAADPQGAFFGLVGARRG